MTIQAAGHRKQNFDATAISGGQQIDMVQVRTAAPPEPGTAQAQGSTPCSSAGAKGVYGLRRDAGTEIGVGPGLRRADYVTRGDGTPTGTETVSINGTVAFETKISGAFKVIRVCQGAAVIQVGNQGPIGLNLVVVNGGRGILFIQGDSNTLVSGSLQR